MKKKRFFFAAAIASVATLMTAAPGLAATTYYDTASGIETMATSTQGWFSGTATGDLPGPWSANIVHTPLAACSSYCLAAKISGGSFLLVTTLDEDSTVVNGSFSGGTVYQTSGFSGCTTQTFNVTGTLVNVGAGGGSGTGTFSAKLTHLRASLFFGCITYGATVTPPTSVPNIVLTF